MCFQHLLTSGSFWFSFGLIATSNCLVSSFYSVVAAEVSEEHKNVITVKFSYSDREGIEEVDVKIIKVEALNQTKVPTARGLSLDEIAKLLQEKIDEDPPTSRIDDKRSYLQEKLTTIYREKYYLNANVNDIPKSSDSSELIELEVAEGPYFESCQEFYTPPDKPENTETLSLELDIPGINQYLDIQGVTVFTLDELEAKLEMVLTERLAESGDIEAKDIDAEIIREELGRIYLERGYLTSTVSVKSDSVLKVIEGRIGEIAIAGRNKLYLGYLCKRVERGVATKRSPVFNASRLEKQLRLLSINPLFTRVNGELAANLEGIEGESLLLVTVTEEKNWQVNTSLDNYAPPSLGATRWGVSLGYRNFTGLGDEISTAYYRSITGGVNLLDVIYRVPVNPKDGTLQLRVTPNWTRITQPPLNELDIKGNKQIYEVNFRQPIIMDLTTEFALSVGFRYQDGQTLGLNRPDLFGSTRTRVIQFQQDYLRRDRQGVWFVASSLNFGTGFFNATRNSDPIPDGRFFSWVGQIQRLQRLNRRNLLVIQGNLQLTPDPLLSDYL